MPLTQVLIACHHCRYSRNRPSRVLGRWVSPIAGQETKGPRSLHGEEPYKNSKQVKRRQNFRR